MMPLWLLGELAATNTRQFSLHWDGLQTDLHETVVSGAIGDGMTYKSFPRTKATLDKMMDFVALAGASAVALFHPMAGGRSLSCRCGRGRRRAGDLCGPMRRLP